MTGRERLAVLEKHLRTKVRPSRFDLHDWKCGTKACAVGHAASIFKSEGLGLKRFVPGAKLSPVFADVEGWDAVQAFFEVHYDAAERLFAEHEYRPDANPLDVADRIAAYLAEPKR